MEIEQINPYTLKILISAREQDSINEISKRIGLSYGWTYKWVSELAKLNVFKISRTKLVLDTKNSFYIDAMEYIKKVFSKDVAFHYSILQLFGVDYCFTKIDAVYIWTKGGYNIGRYKNHYPIYIKLNKKDLKIFKWYCKKLGLKIGGKSGVFYDIEIVDKIISTCVKDIFVDTLDDTISFMKKFIYNFEPALEMIKEMYNKKIDVKYSEVRTNV